MQHLDIELEIGDKHMIVGLQISGEGDVYLNIPEQAKPIFVPADRVGEFVLKWNEAVSN